MRVGVYASYLGPRSRREGSLYQSVVASGRRRRTGDGGLRERSKSRSACLSDRSRSLRKQALELAPCFFAAVRSSCERLRAVVRATVALVVSREQPLDA